ncbi:hypothetical protein TNCV_1192821 [Trichonephila clavipes]|nr:hypothetical protein TNCV_1192821 [Trichonephila clavipes]
MYLEELMNVKYVELQGTLVENKDLHRNNRNICSIGTWNFGFPTSVAKKNQLIDRPLPRYGSLLESELEKRTKKDTSVIYFRDR